MKVKKLSTTPFEVIVNCFFGAFENYYVQFPKDLNYFKQRWESSNIDYSLSFGMFDGEKLVGFILHGIDFRANHLTAFNLATGVIPEYRGKKITKTIYEFAILELKQKGITKCLLEVIKQNTLAVNAYKNIGFNIVRNYKCFAGDLKINDSLPYLLKEINHKRRIELPNQDIYSWENQMESIKKGDFKWYQILNNNQMESFFMINHTNGYIAQLDVLVDIDDAWNRLMSAIQNISSKVRINNVDEQLKSKLSHLAQYGFKNTIDQYEMEFFI